MDYKLEIAKLIQSCKISCDDVASLLVPPKDITMGDICLPCFRLAKELKCSPVAIAERVAAAISENLPRYLMKCTAVAGYLNFTYNSSVFSAEVLENIISAGASYGHSDIGAGKTVCVDYSSVNIAKPFHIGHLSTTVIGGALCRIYKALGYTVVGINHLGDWGTQFGKMIVAYQRWGNKDEVTKDGVKALHKLYVRFHKEAETNDALNDEGRLWFKKIEDGDSTALSLFHWFKDITLSEVSRVYDRLGIQFDSYAGESFYNDKMQPVLDKIEAKGLLSMSNGAKVVDLGEDMPPCLLVKADGATLYATRDLAAAFYRKDAYDFYKCLYVVAYQQNLHFKQWFKVVEMMGEPWAKDLEHVAFGMVSLTDGAMSSRQGNVVYLEDVLNQCYEKALGIITEKSPNLPDKEQIAEQVGIGAVMFSALINNRIKDIVFSYDKVLNFDGETCPYVQYTYARCCSLLAKAELGTEYDYDGIEGDVVKELVRTLHSFPTVMREAAEKYEPSLITRSIVDICQLYNRFYIDNRIIDAPEGVKNARLLLTMATKQVIKNGLGVLGISAPTRM